MTAKKLHKHVRCDLPNENQLTNAKKRSAFGVAIVSRPICHSNKYMTRISEKQDGPNQNNLKVKKHCFSVTHRLKPDSALIPKNLVNTMLSERRKQFRPMAHSRT